MFTTFKQWYGSLALVVGVSVVSLIGAWATISQPDSDPPVSWSVQTVQPINADHAIVFRATEESSYNHHPAIGYQGGVYYAIWSSHPIGEDGPGQRVLSAISRDGRSWSDTVEVFAPLGETRMRDVAGWVWNAIDVATVDGHVYAVADLNYRQPAHKQTDRTRMRIGKGFFARELTEDGPTGEMFPVHELSDRGEAVQRWLERPANQPAWRFSDHATRLNLRNGDYLCEPTDYRRDDDVVRLWRHGPYKRPRHLWAQVRKDGVWGQPVKTDIPDSPSLSDTLMLPDGRIALIGNHSPQDRGRDPLTLSLSQDGQTFDRAYAMRHGQADLRFTDGWGKGGGAQYPSAITAEGALVVIYSWGKEDVMASRINLNQLGR